MLRGTGTTSSVIQAAGAAGAGVSARPNVLVVLVNTKLPTPAAAASSSRVSVPVTVVATKSCRVCEPTCGLCSVAGCRTAPAPARQARTVARSVIDPTTVVNGDAITSRPVTSCPRARRTRTSASPRCPALPVTRTRSPGMRLTILGTAARPTVFFRPAVLAPFRGHGMVGWSDAATPDHPRQACPRRPGRGGVSLVRCAGAVSGSARGGDDPAPGGDRPGAGGVPDHPAAWRFPAGPGGRPDGGVRRSGY